MTRQLSKPTSATAAKQRGMREFDPAPYPRITEYIAERCDSSATTLGDIVASAGIAHASSAQAVFNCETYFPVEWIKPVAAALSIDPVYLLRVFMGNYVPEILALVDELGEKQLLTRAEQAVLAELRQHSTGGEGVSIVCAREATTTIIIQ